MLFIEWELFTIRERTWQFMKGIWSIVLGRSVDDFFEWVLFHDKRKNLNFYEKHSFDFIGMES
jgi:hypothetical protein